MVAEHDDEAVFGPEADLTLFLRMHTEKIAKTSKMYSDFRQKSYGSDFWPEAPK